MESRNRHIAFILGLGHNGLGATRSLGRAGIPVIGLDSNPKDPGLASRYCVGKVCPGADRPDELLRFLIEEGQRLEKPGILYPTSDDFSLFVARHTEQLKARFLFAQPPPEAVAAVVDKRLQYELAEKLGIPCPATFYPQTMEEVHRVKDKVEYPVVVKPLNSRLGAQKLGVKAFKVANGEQFVDRLQQILALELPVVAQSLVPGPVCNDLAVGTYIDRHGTPLALFTLRKVRQFPTECGTGTFLESIYHPRLIELGLAFFHGIGFRGIGSIEFKEDERDGSLYLMEMDVRLWQQNALATACGINFPLIQYLDLIGEPPPARHEHPRGVKWLNLEGDIQAFADHHRRGEMSLVEWLRSMRGVKAFATFAADDPAPFLRQNRYGLRYAGIALSLQRQRRQSGFRYHEPGRRPIEVCTPPGGEAHDQAPSRPLP